MVETVGSSKTLHVFLDESGNFDFTPKGTKYFVLTALSCREPFLWVPKLETLQAEICKSVPSFKRFHASHDRQVTRDQFFNTIKPHLGSFRVDSVIVEKRKTYPPLQNSSRLYPKMMGYLLQYVFRGYSRNTYSKIEVSTDTLPVQEKKSAVKGAIKSQIHELVGRDCPFEVTHRDSKLCFNLQTVDFMSWAIYRKWEKPCERSYRLIKPCLWSEFDIFQYGTKVHY